MRIVSLAVSAMFAAVAGAGAALAAPQAFEDNKLHLKTCDGAHVTVRWLEDNFAVALFGKTTGPAQPRVTFLAWDGSCHMATWDKGQATFVVGKADAAKASPYLQFVAEDDSKWIATRNGDGFFVTRVAGQGEDASNARLAELATWLDQTSHEFTPGALLAKQLATATAN